MAEIDMSKLDLVNCYDSPVKSIMKTTSEYFDGVSTEVENAIKGQIFKITTKYSIDIDEEKLIQILREDRRRYEEAYRKGYSRGLADGCESSKWF